MAGIRINIGGSATAFLGAANSVLGVLGNLNQAVELVGKVWSATGGAIVKQAQEMAREVDGIADAAARLGEDSESLQVVSGAFELAGVKAEVLQASLLKLNKKIGDATAGGTDAAKAFDAFGLKAGDLARMPLEERMVALAAATHQLGSKSAQTAGLMRLLEEGGAALIPAFEGGGEAVMAAFGEVREAGVISSEFVAQAAEMNDQFDLLAKTAQSAKASALEPLLPVISGVTEGIRLMIMEARDAGDLQKLGEGLATFFAAYVLPAVAEVGAAIEKVVDSTRVVAPYLDVLVAKARNLGSAKKTAEEVGAELAFASAVYGLGSAYDKSTERWTKLLADMRKGIKEYQEIVGAPGTGGGAGGGGGPRLPRPAAKDSDAPLLPTGSSALGFLAAFEADVAASLADLRKDVGQEIAGIIAEWDSLMASIEASSGTLRGMFDDAAGVASNLGEGGISDSLRSLGEVAAEVFAGVGKAIQTGAIAPLDAAMLAAQAVAATFGAIGQANADLMADAVAQYEETGQAIEDVEARLAETTDETQRARLEAMLGTLREQQAAERKAAMDAFERSQAAALAQAGIGTALAVINAIATAPNIIAGLVLAGVAAALGAVQIGIIASQDPPSFHAGGVVRDRGYAADEIRANLLTGEGVVNRRGMRGLGEEGLRAINEGRGVGGGGVVVAVNRYEHRGWGAFARDNVSSRRSSLARAIQAKGERAGVGVPTGQRLR